MGNDYILAIETGGTKLQLAIGTPEGEILFTHRIRARPQLGHQGILSDVLGAVPLLQEEARRLGGQIGKIGVGFGGPVCAERGTAVGSAQVEGWSGFPVVDYIRSKTGIPTYLFNDTNAAAWGEYRRGVGRGTDIFFYTNMGSGVGGGIIINGALYDGQGFGAAEFGQSYLCDIGAPTARPEKVENLCSGWAIEARLRSQPIPDESALWTLCHGNQGNLTCLMLGQAVQAGDSYAESFLDHIAHIFSVALANVICLYSPQCLAIGGGVSLIGDPLIQRLRKFTARYIFMSSEGRYHIEKSQLDEAIVLVGVLLLTGEK